MRARQLRQIELGPSRIDDNLRRSIPMLAVSKAEDKMVFAVPLDFLQQMMERLLPFSVDDEVHLAASFSSHSPVS